MKKKKEKEDNTDLALDLVVEENKMIVVDWQDNILHPHHHILLHNKVWFVEIQDKKQWWWCLLKSHQWQLLEENHFQRIDNRSLACHDDISHGIRSVVSAVAAAVVVDCHCCQNLLFRCFDDGFCLCCFHDHGYFCHCVFGFDS